MHLAEENLLVLFEFRITKVKATEVMDLDAYQEKIGGISRYQVLIIATICIITFGTAFTSQAAVFISAVPEHRC